MKRHFSQTISLAVAALCYLAAVGCAVAAFMHEMSGPNDPVRASLMAAVVFFIGCGIVLQVIGTARLKGIISGRNDDFED
ncbi:MAG: hemerythrin family protein [Chromatiaceae bacterium]|nr:hemerythrin family protein [Chromatiaceae bacterium]MCP5440119.1 hemerythrin family protein [Chromatiaceae bacterium]HPE79893.1 hemerythrin family protein [Gammaproteobacteria bacterium]